MKSMERMWYAPDPLIVTAASRRARYYNGTRPLQTAVSG